MLSPFLGALLFLGTAAVIALAVVIAIGAVIIGRPVLIRRAVIAVAGMTAVYGFFWVLGVLVAPTRMLSPGSEVQFCGLDCHLHVSVTEVHPGADLGVTVRFLSNAVREPEWPGKLRFRLRDHEGRVFAPLNEVPDTPLAAGSESSYELRFPSGVQAGGAALIVTWDGGLDYFVPGSGNPLVQRRSRLALPDVSGTGV